MVTALGRSGLAWCLVTSQPAIFLDRRASCLWVPPTPTGGWLRGFALRFRREHEMRRLEAKPGLGSGQIYDNTKPISRAYTS